MPEWPRLLRDIPDFPKPGIVFKDITPVLADGDAFAAAIADLAAPWRAAPPDAVAGIESRGFILGAALARELGAGFVPLRKPGKLPGRLLEEAYALEYGSDRLQLQAGCLPAGTRVLLVDDVLATGGTVGSALRLLELAGAKVTGVGVVLELEALHGRENLAGHKVHSLQLV